MNCRPSATLLVYNDQRISDLRKKGGCVGESTATGCLLRAEFSLFEELAALALVWEVDFCQFSSSRSPFFIEQVAGPCLIF